MRTSINKSLLILILLVINCSLVPSMARAEDADDATELQTVEPADEVTNTVTDADPTDPPPPPDDEDPDAPIDGGLGILIATGIGYGVKKVYNGRKKKPDQAH